MTEFRKDGNGERPPDGRKEFLRGARAILPVLHPKLLAWLCAMLVAWKTRSMLLTIASGLAMLQLFLVVLP